METETAMREYFEKVVNTVRELTTSASRVEGLQNDVNNLLSRVSALEESNNQLRHELQTERDLNAALQNEVEKTKAAAFAANEHANALQAVIVAGNNEVASLKGSLKGEEDSHTITRADLADARRASQEWESQYVATKQMLDTATQDRDNWQGQAHTAQQEVRSLQAQLDRITAILNPPRPVSADVSQVA